LANTFEVENAYLETNIFADNKFVAMQPEIKKKLKAQTQHDSDDEYDIFNEKPAAKQKVQQVQPAP
jgi:hypothetical protein